MARRSSRAAVAAAAIYLLPPFLLVTDAFLHATMPATPTTPGTCAGNKPAPLPPSIRCHSSPLPSRFSKLGDAIASAAVRMSFSAEHIDVSVVPGGGSSSRLTILATYLEPGTHTCRTWAVHRSEEDFFALGTTLLQNFGVSSVGTGIPAPPPRGSASVWYEVYLRKIIHVPEVSSLPALRKFLQAPPDLTQEPVLFGEVVYDDFGDGSAKRFRSANPNDPRTASSSSSSYYNNNLDSNKSGATVAGAIVGGLVAGPVGAAIGAMAARAASGREDGLGSVAKGAGVVADAAMEKARALEKEFELSRKAKTATDRAKQAMQRVDTDYSVRQRAKEAARRTVMAAQRTSRDLRVSERAAGAAKATERAARRAAEVARRANKEHRLRERASNALRLVRSKVKTTVEKLEERRKSGDNGDGAANADR